MKAQLAVREALVRTRTRYISLVSALVRHEGLRIADGEAESFVKRVAALALPVTACAFVSAVDEPERFSGPHQVEAYLRQVPGEKSSGEKQHRGPITKTGDSRVRWLLIQAALSLLRVRRPETAYLREWAEKIAARRGKKLAVVALAHMLAGILFAMMRDGTQYRPPQAQEEEKEAACAEESTACRLKANGFSNRFRRAGERVFRLWPAAQGRRIESAPAVESPHAPAAQPALG